MPDNNLVPPHVLSRRSLLLGVAAGAALVAAGPVVAPRASAAVALDEFLTLSAVLTDEVGPLRDEPGARYLRSLSADPVHAGPLQRLVDVTVRGGDPPRTFAELLATGVLDEPGTAATAARVLELWYSGLVDGQTATYLDALAWTTIEDFAEPATSKIGFAKWSRQP